MNSLRKFINSKEINENENPKKVINIIKKILNFNKQQKGKGIKRLTSTNIFQGLPIALAQVKAGNTCEHLINEISPTIYTWYHENRVTKNCITIEWIQ